MALHIRVLPAVIVLSASALLLTACVQEEPDPTRPTTSPNPTRTIAPSNTATPTATASPKPTAVATTDPGATAVSIKCTALISPQAMYDYNPNFLLLNDFTPSAGSLAATAIASKGVACRWENSTSGVTIDVSVAKPAPNKLDGLKSNAGSRAKAFDGYFALNGGTGTAQVFDGAYWATVSSKMFFEGGDAVGLVAEVRSALN